MIRIENISYGYSKAKLIFIDYSLAIGDGLTYITGINGSGKSTLLKLIMGILRPFSGSIYIDGENIKGIALSKMGANYGYLMQRTDSMLFANTVYEELSFPFEINQELNDNIKSRIIDTLKSFGLYERINTNPKLLSLGHRRRLALAAVFIREPQKFILDEPTAGLDSEMKAQVIASIASLVNQGRSVIIATHDEELMSSLEGNIVNLGGAHES